MPYYSLLTTAADPDLHAADAADPDLQSGSFPAGADLHPQLVRICNPHLINVFIFNQVQSFRHYG